MVTSWATGLFLNRYMLSMLSVRHWNINTSRSSCNRSYFWAAECTISSAAVMWFNLMHYIHLQVATQSFYNTLVFFVKNILTQIGRIAMQKHVILACTFDLIFFFFVCMNHFASFQAQECLQENRTWIWLYICSDGACTDDLCESVCTRVWDCVCERVCACGRDWKHELLSFERIVCTWGRGKSNGAMRVCFVTQNMILMQVELIFHSLPFYTRLNKMTKHI